MLSARLISHFRDVLAGGYWRDIHDKNHRVAFPLTLFKTGSFPSVFLVVSGHYFNDPAQFEWLWHQDQTLRAVKGKLKRQLIAALWRYILNSSTDRLLKTVQHESKDSAFNWICVELKQFLLSLSPTLMIDSSFLQLVPQLLIERRNLVAVVLQLVST